MGSAGEGQNTAHQQKKMDMESLRGFRDRFNIPITDKQLEDVPFYKPADNSEELEYLHERRKALGGFLPQRRKTSKALDVPKLDVFKTQLEGTGEREASTTISTARS